MKPQLPMAGARGFALVVVATLAIAWAVSPAEAAEGGKPPPKQDWSFNGALGTYDKAALQRGLQVYREVCSACHSLKRVAFRNLEALGYSSEQIKSLSAEYEITDGPNDEGDFFERVGLPSDRFPAPFANDNAARAANNGALPPDLSLITKARAGGADYLHALLTGYRDAPAGHEVPDGLYYNEYYASQQLAMAPPLTEGQVDYADGTSSSVEQMSSDVTQFLAWAAEPELEARKQMGFKVLLFLFVLSVVMFFATRRVWSRVE